MEPLPRVSVIVRIVSIAFFTTIVTMILILLMGCTKRAIVKDCKVIIGTPWMNCEVVDEL